MIRIPDIICEVGLNHMGDPKYADTYVSELIVLRPDGITFQFREKEYYETRKGLELSDSYYQKIVKKVQKAGIKMGFSVSDPEKIKFLEKIGSDFYKLLSKDINNPMIVSKLLKTGKPIYVSTGLSGTHEIATFLKKAKASHSPVTLNQTQLTFEIGDANVKAIESMKKKFSVPVSFGLHSENKNVIYLALSFEPQAVLFYVKGNRKIIHKDEKNSIKLSDCPELFANIRELPLALGSGKKVTMENKLYGHKK